MAGLMNEDYTDGIICPYEIPDQWQYEYGDEDNESDLMMLLKMLRKCLD